MKRKFRTSPELKAMFAKTKIVLKGRREDQYEIAQYLDQLTTKLLQAYRFFPKRERIPMIEYRGRKYRDVVLDPEMISSDGHLRPTPSQVY